MSYNFVWASYKGYISVNVKKYLSFQFNTLQKVLIVYVD